MTKDKKMIPSFPPDTSIITSSLISKDASTSFCGKDQKGTIYSLLSYSLSFGCVFIMHDMLGDDV